MNRKRTVLVSVLLLLALWILPAESATVDPMLKHLQAHLADKSAASGPAFTRTLALEPTDDPADPRIGAILHLNGGLPDLGDVPGVQVGSTVGDIATVRLPLSSLERLAGVAGIRHIAASHLQQPLLDIAVPAGNVPAVWTGSPAYTGDGVLVGVIDTGIDWNHEDFKNPDGSTRILAIWDHNIAGTGPSGYGYGVEYLAPAIEAGTAGGKDYNGHGTHVASIAAGNGRASTGTYTGVAYAADLLIVKAFNESLGGFPEDRTIDAMNYLVQKAADLGRPIAINLSLGGHYGAHDGTGMQELAISALSGEGVVFSIAAGNEGESKRHDSASADGGSVPFQIPTYTPASGLDNDFLDLEIWFEGSAAASVSLVHSSTIYGPYTAGTVDYETKAAGDIYISNTVDTVNDDRHVYIKLGDMYGHEPNAGNWTINFTGGTGEVHVWLAVYTMVNAELEFPVLTNSDNTGSVAVPSTAIEAISVAAWKSRQMWPSATGHTLQYDPSTTWGQAAVGDRAPFSSMGPGRLGAEKPDVSAPGMAIIAAYSADTSPAADIGWLAPGELYLVSQGTSMASPFVCGTTALMLQKDPTMSATEVQTAVRASAATDAYTGTPWNEAFGAGKVDADGALALVGDPPVAGDGDVDDDGAVTVLDVVLAVNHIVDDMAYPLTEDQFEAADLAPAPYGNELLDVQDLVRMVAFILGTDAPATFNTPVEPAVLAIGDPYEEGGRWWVDATLSGEAVAAGQFALVLPGACWAAGDVRLETTDGPRVAAAASGQGIRVLLYDLDNELSAAGTTVSLPFTCDGTPDRPAPGGVLAVDPTGEIRAVVAAGPAAAAISLGVWPNPAPGGASVRYSLGRAQSYTLSVFDLRGRRVRVLEQGARDASPAVAVWDGRDSRGRDLPAGVYLVRLRTADGVLTSKVLLSR